MWSAPILCREPRDRHIGHEAAGRRVAADDPGRDAVSCRVRQIGQPAVPVAVVEEDRARRHLVELGERLGLGLDVLHGPIGVGCGQCRCCRCEVRVELVGRVARHQRDDRERDRRRVEKDERRRADPGHRQRGRGHPAPAVPDDLQLGHVQPGCADPGRDVGGGLAEPVAAGPVPGQPVPRQVHRHDPPAGRGQGGPDAPPDPGRGGHAVDQDERPVRRNSPGDRGERDPGRVGRLPQAWVGLAGRGGQALGDRRRQVGRRRADRRRQAGGHRRNVSQPLIDSAAPVGTHVAATAR